MLELTLRQPNDRIPIEADGITPADLAGLSLAEIEKLPVLVGNRTEPLAEHFTVAGDPADQTIRIQGDATRVKNIGVGMTAGTIEVHGNAGMNLGARMVGGEIVVHGNVADGAGVEMTGGSIRIHGNAGHKTGAAEPGSVHGMKGGLILVDGNVGDEVGLRMRRGLIAIGGSSGDFAGASMIAGSLFVFGAAGLRAGAGMRRGTIALFGSRTSQSIPPTFRHSCRYEPQFLPIYLAKLARLAFPMALRPPTVERYVGDVLELGKGEILTPASA